jgi:CheY-like chemotaxis protein
MHVVQIEDESPLRDILKAALQAAQPTIKLQQFGDAESALPYIREWSWDVDLFIIDIRLPGKLNGLDLTQQIRATGCPGYVVLTSAYAAPPKDFLASHRCEYTPKPWHLLDLTQKVFQYQLVNKSAKVLPPALVATSVVSMGEGHPPHSMPESVATIGVSSTTPSLELCCKCKAPLTGNIGVCLKCGAIVKPSTEPETTHLQNAGATPVKAWTKGTANLSNESAITLTIHNHRLRVPKADNIIIGRFQAGQLSEGAVDLSDFEAHKHGVSRRHLKLQQKDGLLYITDLGSSNGTFLNDRRVLPYAARLIRSGDTLKLGGLEVRVEF